MEKKIFKDSLHQNQFDSYGFLKLPFLDKVLLNQIRNFYDSLNINNNTNCLAANIVLTEDQNNSINDYFKEILLEPLEKYFEDFTIYGASFSIKKNTHPELQLHQDPSNFDNEHTQAITIWIPLADVNKDNGAMFVLPGSHKFFDNYVSYTLPSCLIDRKLILNKYIHTIDMKAGEALLFTDKLFHGSYINTKPEERVVLILTLTNKDAKFVYYDKKDDQTIIKYSVEPDDLLNSYTDFSAGKLPRNAKFIKNIPYVYKQLDTVDIYKKLMKTENTSLIQIIIFFKRVFRWLDSFLKVS